MADDKKTYATGSNKNKNSSWGTYLNKDFKSSNPKKPVNKKPKPFTAQKDRFK